jgi:hypothetical protein
LAFNNISNHFHKNQSLRCGKNLRKAANREIREIKQIANYFIPEDCPELLVGRNCRRIRNGEVEN